jgi:hypothetical protein
MDPNTPLHPNLARIASEYDEICSLFAANRIDAGEARRSIASLAARDDNGTIWTIDPASGDWVYRDIHGNHIPGTPPAWGYATPTAYDLTRTPARHDPRDRVVSFAVEDSVVSPPGSLVGSTRTTPHSTRRPPWKYLIAVGVALALGVTWVVFTGPDAPDNAPAPSIPVDGTNR